MLATASSSGALTHDATTRQWHAADAISISAPGSARYELEEGGQSTLSKATMQGGTHPYSCVPKLSRLSLKRRSDRMGWQKRAASS